MEQIINRFAEHEHLRDVNLGCDSTSSDVMIESSVAGVLPRELLGNITHYRKIKKNGLIYACSNVTANTFAKIAVSLFLVK